MVSIPIILLRRRYVTYYIPLVALDVAEKRVVDSRASTRAASRPPTNRHITDEIGGSPTACK